MYREEEMGKGVGTNIQCTSSGSYADEIMNIVSEIRGIVSDIESKAEKISGKHQRPEAATTENEASPCNYSEELLTELGKIQYRMECIRSDIGNFL